MRSLPLLTLLAAVLACSGANSGQRPATVAAPDLEAELTHEVFFGSNRTAPATIEVRVKNNATVPITVRRIDVQSAGQTEWGLVRQSRVFREVVEPGATKPITFFGTAETATSVRNEPLSFEVVVEFESGPEPPARWQHRLNVISTVPPR